MLPVMETFYSLQGEGFHTGKAAFFIRIGGCDVGCRWCDSKESWNADWHPLLPIENILQQAFAVAARAVVITGGEPLQYNLTPLCNLLHENRFEIFLETSGTADFSGSWDWICLSPKIQSPPLEPWYTLAHELKVIIHESSDLEWAVRMAERVPPDCHLFLQPEWSRHQEVIREIIGFILDNPRWRISLQSHKYLKIP